MSERELIAMMAATLSAGDYASGECVLDAKDAVNEAEKILREIDARAAARREPPSGDLKAEDWP